MLNDDELGELLRKELHAAGERLNPRPEFWERFLPTHVAKRRQRFSVRMLAPIGVALFAALAVGVFALASSKTQNAYAVTVKGNSVTITLNQVSAVDALNRRLAHLDLPFRSVEMTASCPTHLGLTYIGGQAHPAAVQLQRVDLPPDVTIIVAAERDGPDSVIFAYGRVTGRVPACVSSHGIGAGLPGFQAGSTTTATVPRKSG